MKTNKDLNKCPFARLFNRSCPVHLGFETYFQGEEDEKKARKDLIPWIIKVFKHGLSICLYGYQSTEIGKILRAHIKDTVVRDIVEEKIKAVLNKGR